MQTIVVKFGLIAGLILAAMVFTVGAIVGDSTDFDKGETLGYIFRAAAFSTIFFGIRELRDKISSGTISFNKAFRTGIIITVIGSACYVIAWLIFLNFIDNTFIERYSVYFMEKVKASGRTPAEIELEIKSFNENMNSYKNPLVMAMFTFLEVFPIGLMISILCSALMKRKQVENVE